MSRSHLIPIDPIPPSRVFTWAQFPWRLAALLAGISILSGLAFTWPLLRFIELDARTTATLVLLAWGPWILLGTLIIVFARIAPLDVDRWKRTLPLHIATCVILALISFLYADWFREKQMGPSGRALFERGRWARMANSQAGEGSPGAPHDDPGPNTSRSAFESRRAFGFGPRGPGEFAPPIPDATTLAAMMLSRSLGSGLIVPIYIVLVAVSQAVRNQRRAEETSRQAELAIHQLAHARLQALQTQLQPHFLFNTLNAVTNYIHTQPQIAEEMLCSLSDLLRRVLNIADHTEIPLSEELELVELYLNVQRHRFTDRLLMTRHIDEDLLNHKVPPLILQPIVENAIIHGIAQSTTPGQIELHVEAINQQMRISVIAPEAAPSAGQADASAHRAGGGVGLANIRHRLTTLYGPQASLHAKSRTRGGFLTEISLPLQLASPTS